MASVDDVPSEGVVMKAFAQRSFGPPEVLELVEVPDPVPYDDGVLIRVAAASVQPFDWHCMRGEPRVARLMGDIGLRRPRRPILGADVAGVVVATGRSVTDLEPGDAVMAMPRGGGFAEYVDVPAAEVVRMPAGLSFAQAAAIPLAGATALLAVRECAEVQPGERVAVTGASGGVGTFAVQIAKARGAQVTAVCGAGRADLMRSIGAHEVVDRSVDDVTRGGARFDAVIDVAGAYPLRATLRMLHRAGRLVLVGGPAGRWVQPAGRVAAGALHGRFVPQSVSLVSVVGVPDIGRILAELSGLVEAGGVAPVIDRTFDFEQLPEALRHSESGRAAGKIVVTVP